MQISQRVSEIAPSMTLAINAKAQKMRADGIEVLNLSAGEPDFPTPDFIKEAAKKAIDENFTRYTPVAGIPELRRAAAEFFLRHYATEILPECIIIGAGGKQCISAFMETTLNPGDEVLIPAPYWVSYPDIVRIAGAAPIFVPTSASAGYKPNPQILADKATAKTRLLVLNSPNNPTGAVYSESELDALMEWALSNNICVLSDEIYSQITFPPAIAASAITWFARYPQMVAVVNGLSKSHSMTGWRVGFTAADPELVRKIAVLQGHTLSNICSIAQKAGVAALEGPQECVAAMRVAFERRRDLSMKIISGWKKAICPAPGGAFYLFVDLSGYYNEKVGNSSEMCACILEKAHVASVPGIAFGDDNCVRFSYATDDRTLERALLAVGECLKEL